MQEIVKEGRAIYGEEIVQWGGGIGGGRLPIQNKLPR